MLPRPVLITSIAAVFAALYSHPLAQAPSGKAPSPAVRTVPRAAAPAPLSGSVDPKLFGEMRWRSIGPFRGGRTKAAAGVPGQPFTFYIGVCNGGVWKTTDAGRTWQPIFDGQPTGSIGSIAVAPSNPDVVYVGSGEGLGRPDLSVGDGVYRSDDAGATWTHLGLEDGQQLPSIAVDPKDPNRLFVAVAGHPYGPNEERGIFRSTDGGKSFQKVLYKDKDTGGNDVDIDPSNPSIVYATLWEERQGPWENAQWRGQGGGIYKSIDGGTKWKQLTNGLPEGGAITQANLVIAPSNPKRIYATVAVGPAVTFYRSDDSGETWTQATTDTRPTGRIGGGDLAVPLVNPRNADVVIMASTVSYKSTDAGKSWVPFKGAPGGDDYQNGWINPENPDIILLASDQGAVVTLNGGQSWSSWYNQPTAQLYHVNADDDFPYRVCSGQQESGSACVASRGNDGEITFREWHPVGVEEYGYAVPDPLDPDVIFGGKITRYDRRTGQVQNISPVAGGRGGPPPAPGTPAYRTVRTQPVAFSPIDRKTLFFANNYLWKTVDGGVTWRRISDDPTRKTYGLPAVIGKYAEPSLVVQRGVIYSIAPSSIDINRIWIGTDDGVIKTTADGGATWKDVTPPALKPWMKVFNIDAGRFDALTAYAAVNTLRLDDMHPYIFRTHDGGRTWTEINAGLEGGGPTSSVREDPKRKGLLYAATERRVYVSFDDGGHWQSLQLNMAPSSVRDITIKGDDLIAATHGRGFWILDDLEPLRQLEPTVIDARAHLFRPQAAWRVRWNTNTDTPLPPEEPAGLNPPEGAIIDYYLKTAASGAVSMEITGSDGKLVRRYSSADEVTMPDPATSSLPLYWFRPPMVLSTEPGMHRFTWDLHYQPLAGASGGRGGLPIAAVAHNTVPAPAAPWVPPGDYTVTLTVDGKRYTQPITVKQDPRVKTPAAVMQQIYTLTKAAYYEAVDVQDALQQARDSRPQLAGLIAKDAARAAALMALDKKVEDLIGAAAVSAGAGGRGGGRGGFTAARADSLSGASSALAAAAMSLGVDAQPTMLQLDAVRTARAHAARAMAQWTALKAQLGQGGVRVFSRAEEEALVKKARGIHERVITLDTHDDINANNFTAERNYTQRLENQVNLPKMVEGGLDAAFFAVYVGQGQLTPEGYANAYKQAVDKFDAIHRFTEQIAPHLIGLALTSADLRRIAASGRKVALIGVENGYSIGEDLSRIKEFAARGARSFSLSHNGHSQLSDSNTGEREGWKWNGLSPLGKQAIVELNRQGVIIDVSHPSKESMMQTLQITKAPIIASHSAVRALCNHSRNLDDEQLLALKKNGGVIQVVAFAGYVKDTTPSPERATALDALRKEFNLPAGAYLGGRGGRGRAGGAMAGLTDDQRADLQKKLAEVDRKFPAPARATVKDFVDHIDYVVRTIGIDHAGISTDFDGGGGVDGWNGAEETFNVTLELVRRGYTEAQIAKIWSGNLLRVLDDAQRVAARMKNES